jgi:hypothetical protein
MQPSDDILIGAAEVKEFCRVQDERTMKNLIASGLPVFRLQGRYYSSKRAINEWFSRMAIKQVQDFRGEETS